jgi:alpha/beta superfamily hydrolase
VHDDGNGEQDDLRAALADLRGQGGLGLPTVLAGFSFGSVISARVAVSDPTIDGLLLVGAPVRLHAFEELVPWGRAVAFVQGDDDEHGPLPRLQSLLRRLHGPAELRVIAGADHFFHEHQDALRATARELVETGVLAAVVALGTAS